MAELNEIRAKRDRALTLLEDLVLSFGEPERPQFIQQMPIRITVWRSLASNPDGEHNLLITPNDELPVRNAVRLIRKYCAAAGLEPRQSGIIALKNSVQMTVRRKHFVEAVLTATDWFHKLAGRRLRGWFEALEQINRIAQDGRLKPLTKLQQMRQEFRRAPEKPFWRFIAAWTIISYSTEWARQAVSAMAEETGSPPSASDAEVIRWGYIEGACEGLLRITETDDLEALPDELTGKFFDALAQVLDQLNKEAQTLTQSAPKIVEDFRSIDGSTGAAIWSIDMNRPVELAIHRSRQTVKVDAAEQVFQGSAAGICWAVIDSGIDATHPAFTTPENADVPESKLTASESRIAATYDFNRLNELYQMNFLSLLNDKEAEALETARSEGKIEVASDNLAALAFLYQRNAPRRAREPLKHALKQAFKSQDFLEFIGDYATDVERRITLGEVIDWPVIEPLLRVSHEHPYYEPPLNHHGTHVAGTIAGSIGPRTLDIDGADVPDEPIQGMCPDMSLIDMRVCDADGGGAEFLVLAALQLVDYLNTAQDRMRVHGVNLSLSIRHLVRNFGCGHTPVCREANDLVSSGVVVVAAAGNRGFDRLRTETGFVDSYSWSSITDPGNAEDVITVGSTHRTKPHTYGVSYFSSRGPTGDGRQ
ncbi:MAG: S8 family serine peptidase, partial [Pseudomonadota bacterium]